MSNKQLTNIFTISILYDSSVLHVEKGGYFMNTKTTSIVSYITWIGWIVAIILGDKNDPEVNKNLNQALVLNIVSTASGIVIGILSLIPLLGVLFAILGGLISLVCFILAVMGIVNAVNGDGKVLPVVGAFKIIK